MNNIYFLKQVMEKQQKKYIIKESELKEIIKEMIILEAAAEYNPDSPNDMHTKYYKGPSNIRILDRGENLFNGIKKGLQNFAAGTNSDFLKTIFGADDTQAGNGYRGTNFNAQEPLNVAQASRFIRAKAQPYYIQGKCGNCARAVRRALAAGGLKGMANWKGPYGMFGGSAKYYINILPANGWTEIGVGQAGQPGDVCVIDECDVITPQGKRSHHEHGHISMCIGNGVWVSDFVQKNMYGLDGTPPPSKVHVFRYNNRV